MSGRFTEKMLVIARRSLSVSHATGVASQKPKRPPGLSYPTPTFGQPRPGIAALPLQMDLERSFYKPGSHSLFQRQLSVHPALAPVSDSKTPTSVLRLNVRRFDNIPRNYRTQSLIPNLRPHQSPIGAFPAQREGNMAQKCVHQGCNKEYTDPDEICRYHPGPPIFHEGQKGMMMMMFSSRPSPQPDTLLTRGPAPVQDGSAASPASSRLKSS